MKIVAFKQASWETKTIQLSLIYTTRLSHYAGIQSMPLIAVVL